MIGLQYSERFDYFAMSDPGFQFYVFEIRIPSELTIDLRMSKELLWSKVGKLFGKKELEVGVKEFDSKILVEPSEESEFTTDQLLKSDLLRRVIVFLLYGSKGDKQQDHLEIVNRLVGGRIIFATKTEDEDLLCLRAHALAFAKEVEAFASTLST